MDDLLNALQLVTSAEIVFTFIFLGLGIWSVRFFSHELWPAIKVRWDKNDAWRVQQVTSELEFQQEIEIHRINSDSDLQKQRMTLDNEQSKRFSDAWSKNNDLLSQLNEGMAVANAQIVTMLESHKIILLALMHEDERDRLRVRLTELLGEE